MCEALAHCPPLTDGIPFTSSLPRNALGLLFATSPNLIVLISRTILWVSRRRTSYSISPSRPTRNCTTGRTISIDAARLGTTLLPLTSCTSRTLDLIRCPDPSQYANALDHTPHPCLILFPISLIGPEHSPNLCRDRRTAFGL